MADIMKKFMVRSSVKEKPKRLTFYFDSGSPVTIIRQSAVIDFKNVLKLVRPEKFKGLGKGVFYATHIMNMQILMLGIWCRHIVYVVPDDALGKKYHVLVGHDFMQKFDIKLDFKKKKVTLDKSSLEMAEIIK